MKSKSAITHLLIDLKNGSENAYEELFPLVYEELKHIALSKLHQERKDHTLSKTALVHEVYLKMIDQTRIEAKDKNHFLAISARCMRQILIDHARKKQAEKRGGDKKDITYIDELMNVHHKAEELLDIDKKLKELAKLNERLSDVVELRFFGQMTISATADVLELSESTVKRDWQKARAWLYKEIKSE